MSSQVPPRAGPSPTAGLVAEKEAESADFCLLYSGALFRSLEVTQAVWGECPPETPSTACCGDANRANSPGTIPVSVGAEP